jgi:hypothetical protein
MNLFVPKTNNIRQQILDFLSDKRKATDLKKNDINECSFSITEISEQLNIKRNLVDEQMDVLYKLKQVECLHDNVKDNKFFINVAGFYASASKEPLNEGKLLNSQIISNYTNSFFQVLTGFIALYTIYKSYTTVDAQNIKIGQLQQSILKLEKQLKNQQQLGLNLNQDTLQLNRPTNVQKSSYKLDTLK